MSAVADRSAGADGSDGRTRVVLSELLALRTRLPLSLRLHPGHARSALAGSGRSRQRGRGMDYAESRMYQPGDDVRQLDWRLTARSGRLHTKIFEEERERTLVLLLDTHADMRFGTRRRFKSVQAARAAAFAAWCAVRGGERVGMAGFGARRDVLRPRGGPRGALAVAGALTAWDDAGGNAREPLSMALQRVARLVRHAGRVLLISDGAAVDDAARAQLLQLRRHADVCVLVVADALELAPPPPGRYPLATAAGHRLLDLLGRAQRERFRDALGAGAQRLRDLSGELGLACRVIDTRADAVPAVLELLGRGARR